MGDVVGADALGDVRRIGGVDRRRGELPTRSVAIHDPLGPRWVQIGEHDVLVEVTSGGDRCERRPHPTGAHHQDPHGAGVYRSHVRHPFRACTGVPSMHMGPIKRLLAKLRGRGQDEDIRRQLERENEGLWKKRIPPTPRR